MARTKETARKTTGGKAPSKTTRAPVEAPKKGKKTLPPPVDSDSSDDSSSSSDASSAVIVASKKGSKATKPVAPKKTVVAKPAPKKAAAAKKAAAKKVVGKPSKKAEPVDDDSSSESDSQSGSSLGSDSGSESGSTSDDSSSSASPPPTPKKGGRASKKVEASIVLSDSDSDSGSDDVSGSDTSGSSDDDSSSSSVVPPPAPKGRSSKKAETPAPAKPVKGKAETKPVKGSAKAEKVTSETPTSYYITQADLFKILFGKNKPDSKTVKALTPYIYVPVETDVVVVKFNSGLGAYFAGRWVFDPKTQAVFAKIENKKGKPTVVPLEKSDAKDLESTNVWSAGKSTYASEKEIATLLAESVAYHEGLTSGKSTASRGGSEVAEKKAWGDDSSESGDDGVITDPIDRVSAERKRTTTGGSTVKITAETFGKFVSAQKRVESKVDTGAIAREAGISEAESREILLKYKFYESQFPAALTAALVARPPASRTPAEPAPSRGRDAGSNGGFNQRRSNSAGPAMGGGRQFSNAGGSKRL